MIAVRPPHPLGADVDRQQVGRLRAWRWPGSPLRRIAAVTAWSSDGAWMWPKLAGSRISGGSLGPCRRSRRARRPARPARARCRRRAGSPASRRRRCSTPPLGRSPRAESCAQRADSCTAWTGRAARRPAGSCRQSRCSTSARSSAPVGAPLSVSSAVSWAFEVRAARVCEHGRDVVADAQRRVAGDRRLGGGRGSPSGSPCRCPSATWMNVGSRRSRDGRPRRVSVQRLAPQAAGRSST